MLHIKKMMPRLLMGFILFLCALAISPDAQAVDSDWEYESYGDGIVVTAYNGTAEDVYVPSELDDQPVIKLGDDLFRNNDALNSVTLGEGIIEIGARAFYDCDNLVCIVTNERLTTIGAEAFYSCDVFNSVILYDAVNELGTDIFAHCPKLTVWCNENTVSYSYVTTHKIPFEILNPEASPEIYVQDGITYYIMNGEAIAVGFNECTIEVSVPAIVTGYPVTELRSTFLNCGSLEKIRLPETLREIGEESFCWCESLQTVIIPESVTRIGKRAFGYCTSLQSIIIPNSVISIESYAFFACFSLRNIIIPGSVISIENNTFDSCANLQCVVILDGVTSIGSYAFDSCDSLQSVSIPDSVTSIGNYAFSGCSTLQSISIPHGVTKIGSYAFSRCSILESVTLSEGVATIGNYAFEECYSLQSIFVPKSVTSIRQNSFPISTILLVYENSYAYRRAEYYGLMYLVYDGINIPTIYTIDGISYYVADDVAIAFNCDKNLTTAVLAAEVGGCPVTELRGIFQNCDSLVEVVLPETLQIIGEKAFYSCIALENITIPNSVTSIGSYAFSQCGLQSITIPESINSIENHAFYDCTALQSVVIPQSITSIEEYAFSYCYALESVVIPNGVTSIGSHAFSACIALESVVIPEGVTCIENFAFFHCDVLQSVVVPESVNELYINSFSESTVMLVYKNSYAHTFAVNNGMTYSLYDGTNAPINYMVDGIYYTVVDGSAIAYKCDDLLTEAVVLAEVNGYLVTELRGTFKDCANLREVMLPDTLRTIGEKAFYGCRSLESVIIPNSVTKIEGYAFSFCASLSSINIPNGIRNIEHDTFNGCSALQNIIIPNSVKSIGEYAFNNCSSLQSIAIPNGVTSIETHTFSSCTALQNVTIPNSVSSIGVAAFESCGALQSIKIPESVTHIDGYAFSYCSALQSIIIPEGVASIGGEAFRYCSALKNVTFPESLVSIGGHAFTSCISLHSITLPESVTTIADGAFNDCSALKTVLVPRSVQNLYIRSFPTSTVLLVYNNSYAHKFAEDNKLLYFVLHRIENPEIAYGACITGTVTYMDGSAASGLNLEILYDDGTVKEIVTTDSVGVYSFTYAEVGQYTIRVMDTMGNTASTLVSVKRINAFDVLVTGDTNLTLKRGWTVSGTVSDVATVTIADAKGNVLESVQSAEGNFVFSNVPNGTYVLKAEADMGSVTKEITVYNGNLSGIALEFPKQIATVWGFTKVENRDGVCVLRNWVNVALYNSEGVVVAQAKTDAEGKFHFENLPLDSYRIVAQTTEFRPDHHGRPFDRSYTLTGFAFANASVAGEYQADIILREVHGQETSISGKITAHGQTQDSEVILRDVEGNEYARYITGKNGKFSFVNIPDGVYIITATTPSKGMGYTVITVRDGVVNGNMDITVYKDGKLTQMEEEFYGDLGACATPEDAQNLRSRIAQEKRYYDSLSEKEKKQLSKEYVQTLNQLVEWAVSCSYMTEDGVVLSNGGTVISGDELENGESVSFNLSVEKVQYSQISADGVKNATDYIYYDMLDAAGESQIKQYYEISMTKTVGNTQKVITSVTKDTDTTGTFRITMEIPEEYRGQKHYTMLHVHNGETMVLADLDEDPNTITFEVTGFSTFALAASDEILIPVTNAQIWQSTELFGNYISLEDALSGYDSDSQYIKLAADSSVNFALTQDLYIDLNGFDLSGAITTNGYKIYGMDSSTNAYTCEAMGAFNCVDENGNAIVPERQYVADNGMRYLTIATENGYTFHRFYLGITNISLAPSVTGFGYKAEFYGDEMVQSQIESIGYNLWLTEDRVVSRTADFKNSLTLRLKNFDVENYGETPVNACVRITLVDGTVITGETHSNTMKQVVESVNTNYESLTEAQMAAVNTMIASTPTMQTWQIENLYKKES